MVACGEVEEGVADEGVSHGLLVALLGALLSDDAVHLRAVYRVCTLDRAHAEQVGVAARGGVGERRACGWQGETIVGVQRPTNLGRRASIDVVSGHDAPGTTSGDAALRGEHVNDVVDAARVERRVIDDVPVNFVRGAAEQDVDVGVPPGPEDTQRMARENGTRLRVVIDDAGRGAIDALPLPELTGADPELSPQNILCEQSVVV